MGGDGYSPAAALSPGLEKPDEQRTSPTSIPADTGCSFRQRGLYELHRQEE